MRDDRAPSLPAVSGDRAGKAGHSASRPICPQCGSAVDRVPRRWMDRLVSLFTPTRRYRCRSLLCRWEGRVRSKGFSLSSRDSAKRYDRRIDAP